MENLHQILFACLSVLANMSLCFHMYPVAFKPAMLLIGLN